MPMVAERKNIKTSNNVTLLVIVGWSDTALTPNLMKEHGSTVGQADKKEKGKAQLCSLAPILSDYVGVFYAIFDSNILFLKEYLCVD